MEKSYDSTSFGKKKIVVCVALLLLLFSGCAGAGRYKTGKHFFDYERTWEGEDLFVESFIFGGAGFGYQYKSDNYAILQVEGASVRLAFKYWNPAGYEFFYLPYTEEEKAAIEAGEAVERKDVWKIESNLQGETLTITVTHDFGYEDGLYFSDFTGKTFVLTEQSHVF